MMYVSNTPAPHYFVIKSRHNSYKNLFLILRVSCDCYLFIDRAAKVAQEDIVVVNPLKTFLMITMYFYIEGSLLFQYRGLSIIQ